MNDQAIEAEIQAKGLTAPRITPQAIEDAIHFEYYLSGSQAEGIAPRHPALGLLTLCVLVLRNGFTVVGESACASPENFNAELGRKIAREHAKQKVWALEGYLLRERLFEQKTATTASVG